MNYALQTQKKTSILARMINTLTLKRFWKEETNPQAPAHGSTFVIGGIAHEIFEPIDSMSAYAAHSYLAACVSKSSRDLAALPYRVYDGDKEVFDTPFHSLMNNPNSTMGEFLFREQNELYLELTGDQYLLIVGGTITADGSIRNPTALFPLHPQNTRIAPHPTKLIGGYVYQEDGSATSYPPERIIHIRKASWSTGASGLLYGTGVIESLKEELSGDINAKRMAARLSKQGRPDLIITPTKGGIGLDPKIRESIKNLWLKMTRWGEPAVISSDVTITPLHLTPRDMEFSHLTKEVKENISAVTGVPTPVVGAPDAKYSNAEQAILVYWENQKIKGRRVEEMMTKIARMFNPRYSVKLDYSGVPALQNLKNAQLNRVEMHIINGADPKAAYEAEGLVFPEPKKEDRQSKSTNPSSIKDDLMMLSKMLQKNSDVTNFPKEGDDKKVSLRNSEYARFPWKEAEKLKKDYPEIWKKGGNIEGNNQFRRLLPIAKRSSSAAETETEEKAIRKREAWAARHKDNHRLAGVVAQIKWLVVGSRGLSHMRKVISEAKEKADKGIALD